VGSPQQGFAAGEQQVDPATAIISGPQSLVELVDSATAEVPLTGLRVDYTEDRVTLAPRDARGGEIGRVSVSPATAGVSVKILQREFSLEFSVNPTISGIPASGYNVVSIAVDPSTVTMSGSLDILQTIDPILGISTSEISISDARASVVQQVELDLPTSVGVIGSNQVVVTVTIAPARGEVSFLVTPQVRNVGEGLVVTTAAPVYVTLTGDVPILQALTPESIVVISDAAGLDAGLHVLALDITAPAGTTLARVEPGELGIALTPR
jgi:YbbR domain-containing protein